MIEVVREAAHVTGDADCVQLTAKLLVIVDQLGRQEVKEMLVQAERPHNMFFYHLSFTWSGRFADIQLNVPGPLDSFPKLKQANDLICQQVQAEPGTLAIIGIHLLGSAYVSPLIIPGQ